MIYRKAFNPHKKNQICKTPNLVELVLRPFIFWGCRYYRIYRIQFKHQFIHSNLFPFRILLITWPFFNLHFSRECAKEITLGRCNFWSSRKAWLLITIFATSFSFSLPSFCRRKEKKNNQTRGHQSCLSARSDFWMKIISLNVDFIKPNYIK